MTFAQEVKKELCKVPIESVKLAVSECYGIFLFANVFRADEIRIITENRDLASRISALLSYAFSIDAAPSQKGEGVRFVFRITDQMQLFHIFEALAVDPDNACSKIEPHLIADEKSRNAFLRGAFLSGASVADPSVRYHLEFSTPFLGFSGAMQHFFTQLNLTPRVTARSGKYVIYFKSSEAIEDILTRAGAHHSSLTVMEKKVVKEVRNGVNRYVNCETANITRTVAAAKNQTRAIRQLESDGRLEVLPKELRETALVRLENPEASLSALGEMLDPPVNRATINYRLKKLMEIAGKEEKDI